MCGILGQININSGEALRLDLDSIGHRGPDGRGEWKNSNGNVYLGHTRLAILDPTPEGNQPMSAYNGAGCISFNGEIYNHHELRTLLPNLRWRGNSDTETLIELLVAKGIEALSLLKGMFAFAFYDARDQSLLLVRDRLGIKPLYVKIKDDAVSFSSEVRPLLDKESINFSKAGMSEYIGFGHFPQQGEILNQIFSIPAGSWMRIGKDGEITENKWWGREDFASNKKSTKKLNVRLVRELVTRSIEEHLISDVGIGAFLSGGIDSSIVALVAGKALGSNLRTFTVGFPEENYDERHVARKVAKKIGSDHTELEISDDTCLSWVEEAVLSLDLPSVDAINTYIISKAVSAAGLKVALSGLGADELFGGYPAFKKVPSVEWLSRMPDFLKRSSAFFLPQSLKMKLDGLSTFSAIDLAIASRRFTSVSQLKNMGLSNGSSKIPPVPEDFDHMSRVSWAELYGYMIPMLLRDSDQMSMAVGLEIRVPFLDHQLVQEILCLSQQSKKGNGVKPLLVESFKDMLLPEVYDRPKQGFALPMGNWIKGPLKEFTQDGISAAAEYLNNVEPQNRMLDFMSGRLHWTRVWQFSVLGHWLIKKSKSCNKEPKLEIRTVMGNPS